MRVEHESSQSWEEEANPMSCCEHISLDFLPLYPLILPTINVLKIAGAVLGRGGIGSGVTTLCHVAFGKLSEAKMSEYTFSCLVCFFFATAVAVVQISSAHHTFAH